MQLIFLHYINIKRGKFTNNCSNGNQNKIANWFFAVFIQSFVKWLVLIVLIQYFFIHEWFWCLFKYEFTSFRFILFWVSYDLMRMISQHFSLCNNKIIPINFFSCKWDFVDSNYLSYHLAWYDINEHILPQRKLWYLRHFHWNLNVTTTIDQ